MHFFQYLCFSLKKKGPNDLHAYTTKYEGKYWKEIEQSANTRKWAYNFSSQFFIASKSSISCRKKKNKVIIKNKKTLKLNNKVNARTETSILDSMI